jgi:drug/metabolite transporter (DMT)-like permease
MIVYWLAYEGFSKGQLAVLNPVFASYSGVVAIVAAIAFHEHLGWLMAVALVGIFVGILLLNVDLPGLRSKKLNIVPGLKEMGLAALLAAIWTLGWDKFVTDKDPVSYALLMYFFMTLAAIGLARLMRVKVKGRESVLWKPLALVGLCEAIAYLCISWGYSATSLTGVVALISGAFSLPTIILARLFLKERITTLQTIAVGIIIVSLIVVAVS